VRVYVEAAGCDRRQLDTESIRSYLRANDYQLVDNPAEADRILAVTCAFKKKEEDESVRRLRSLRRYGKDILVYGCLADIAAGRYEEFGDLPSVSPRELDTIDRHFEGVKVPFAEVRDANVTAPSRTGLVRARRRVEAGLIPSWRESVDWLQKGGFGSSGQVTAEADRPFSLFVCRGCAGLCSYCAIRRAIGTVRSKPVDEILSEFHRGVEEGYRTFNILGDDPGCYGIDIESSLPVLLRALFDARESLEPHAGDEPNGSRPIRFRIREIHPKFLIPYHEQMLEMEGFSTVENVLVPVQSGSDPVLQRMEREHTAADLLEALRRITDRCPTVRLDTQVIVGFPGETEADLERSLEFVREAQFASVVLFPYDDKEGSTASMLGDKIPQAEIRRRMRRSFRYFDRNRIQAYSKCP
jgi:tRNA A37 methylthiotransferase MiaB